MADADFEKAKNELAAALDKRLTTVSHIDHQPRPFTALLEFIDEHVSHIRGTLTPKDSKNDALIGALAAAVWDHAVDSNVVKDDKGEAVSFPAEFIVRAIDGHVAVHIPQRLDAIEKTLAAIAAKVGVTPPN